MPAIPLTALHADTNLVEFLPPQVPGDLRWVETGLHFDGPWSP